MPKLLVGIAVVGLLIVVLPFIVPLVIAGVAIMVLWILVGITVKYLMDIWRNVNDP